MSENSKIRIGIVGAGFIGKVHAKQFNALTDEAEIVVIGDPFEESAKKAAEEFSIPEAVGSSDAVLERDDLDAVVLAVPNKTHAPLAIQALESGKNVLLEKPMALNAEQSKSIVRAQQAAGKILMMGHQMRFSGYARRIKAMLEAGDLGKVYAAKTGWLRRKGIPGWGSWFTRMDEAGGGPLIDIGVHMLDLSLYLMGGPKPVAVYGSTYAEFGPRKMGTGTWGTPDWDGVYDVEDLASAMIKMDDGSTLSLDVSWALNSGEFDFPFVHLFGNEGGVAFKKEATFYQEKDGELSEKELEPLEGEDRRFLAAYFLECVRDGKQPHNDAMSGLTNMLILDAIYQSSKTGEVVQLDYSL